MYLPELSPQWKTGLSLAWTFYIAVLSLWIMLQKRTPVATLGWILSLSALPYAGFIIYYFLGPQRLRKQRIKRLRSRVRSHGPDDLALIAVRAHDAPPSLRQLSALATASCGLPLSSALTAELLSGGARTFDAIFAAIDAAQSHIHLEYYIYEPDRIGTQLRDRLVARARAGVQVRLLIDALGSKRVGRRFLAPLLEAGAHVALFHDSRIGRRLRPVINYRTHRKIVVCDGRVGFTGGVNITDEEDQRVRDDAYHDVHLRLEGAAVRWLQTIFLEDWAYATGERPGAIGETLPDLLPEVEAGRIPVQIVSSGPDTPLEAIHRMHVSAIHSATQRCWLTTPYFVPTEAALMALTSAALRGVDVRLLVPRRSDSRIVSAAARSYYDELIAAGVKIWEYRERMLHSKTMVIDAHCAMVGTANFDNRSFALNFEVMAVVYGEALAASLVTQFEDDLRHASPVRRRHKRPFRARLGEAGARLLSPLL